MRYLILLFLFIPSLCFGALVEGINCGFVTTAPTADPADGTLTGIQAQCRSGKFTAPAGATSITEIGWWCDNATEEANFELGIYSDNGGGATSLPATLQSGVSRTNAKGTDAGWKKATVSIPVTAGTIYWLTFQLDNTATPTHTNFHTGEGRRDKDTTDTATLPDTWISGGAANDLIALYAVYTTGESTRRIIFMQ
ncbi:hypothetical protein M0R04_11965 [Candidatus Dojkabacteria bacterium]|jgi:hypothetical protein|nr:hypothetical protein [Candidatus Dojkabacteria bacterium]